MNTIHKMVKQGARIISRPIYLVKKTYYSNLYGKEIVPLLDEDYYNIKVRQLRSIPEEKRKYFIISRSYAGMGIYSHVCIYLSFIAYCINKGYWPVIDMRTYPNIYNTSDEVGKTNAWSKFFNQPMDVGLDEISQTLLYSSSTFLPKQTPFINSLLHNEKERQLYQRIYRDFIRFNDATRKYIDDELQLIMDKRVLGVLFRGTDYSQGKPHGHPVQPDVRFAIDDTEKVMQKYGCDYIYLATEEERAVNSFQQAFPNRVIVNKRMYYDKNNEDYSKKLLYQVHFDRPNDEYLKGIEYISSINILSKCACFIGGGCAGTYAAIIMNDSQYEYWDIWDLGLYE